jgi:hypothetical protein
LQKGDSKGALAFYEKALELATAQKNTSLIATLQAQIKNAQTPR